MVWVLSNSKLSNTILDKANGSNDRRRSRRFKANFEAELTVNLSLLDASAVVEETLLLMGQTQDVSAGGLTLIVPCIRIDERYCAEERPLTLSLHLETEDVKLELRTIYCNPLKQNDPDRGYLIGARITDFGKLGPLGWQHCLSELDK
jgi:hypothetical protein